MKIFEERPWGSFTVLRDAPGYKVKEISINPHSRLSLQSHQHREEFWVVVRGTLHAICEGNEYKLTAGESIHIPKQAKHRLINPYSEAGIVIETQLGEYLEEDDIQRFEDDYKRT